MQIGFSKNIVVNPKTHEVDLLLLYGRHTAAISAYFAHFGTLGSIWSTDLKCGAYSRIWSQMSKDVHHLATQ